ncbi:CID domain [Macleaya cordata]|uniref:CID domain n=1 Tax=Macleaya cordata TaxID=56857 RepID=A0A200QJF6_MACCD|nr:CID domain [Macleaya cordata]
MEEWFLSSRSNPRNLGFLPEHGVSSSNNNKAMPAELIQKPPSPVLDRFRALLKEREDELRVSDDEDDFTAPSAEDIVRLYDLVLSELTFNSKPIITDLTIIAGEQREFAEGIADVICNRIVEVSVDQKLPSLYLLDSIVKNIGSVYVRYFASRLHEVFCVAYKQVHPNLHPAMRHLFGTWSAVFPPSVLRRIAAELQLPTPTNHQSSGSIALSSSESMSPRPAHGIHVNPKYLEARRQFEHATVVNDVQPSRGISSSLQMFGKKPDFGYGEYDVDHSEIINQQVRAGKLGSPGIAARTSSIGVAERILPSKIGPARLLSPSRNGFGTDNSPERAVDRASPSHYGFEYGPRRMSGRDGERNDWWIKHGLDADDQQRPRALIDAYGNYRGKNALSEKPLKVERLDVNCINSEASTRSWQNTEEEEYVWEDMSPTLADHSRSNDSMPFNPPLGSLKTRNALGHPTAALLEPEFRRGNWPSQSLRTVVDDPATTAEDGISILGPGRGSMSKKAIGGPQTPNIATQIQGPPYAQEPWNLPSHLFQSFQHINQASGRAGQMSYAPAGTAPSAGQRMPSFVDNNNNHKQPALLQPHLLKPQEARESFNPSIPSQVSSHLVAQPLNHGHNPQGYSTLMSTPSLNQIPFPSVPIRNMPNNTSFQLQGGALPPLPPGPPPTSLQLRPTSQNMGPIASYPPVSTGYSGLISSLMAQGLISLTTQAPAQDSVGVEFDPDVLKVRHESAIKALYSDLPRQCTIRGLCFKCQEEHSSHMDWHVTKNRMSRNRKQQPSRKWFVSTSLWLSGAETLGTDAVPGFLPTEAVVEKKDDEEMAVPADENQNACALCGEPFDDFYSDETEEWMYKGAVYLNAIDGTTQGVDRSLLGPIVHAKCRSGSSVISSEAFGQDERERTDEGVCLYFNCFLMVVEGNNLIVQWGTCRTYPLKRYTLFIVTNDGSKEKQN